MPSESKLNKQANTISLKFQLAYYWIAEQPIRSLNGTGNVDDHSLDHLPVASVKQGGPYPRQAGKMNYTSVRKIWNSLTILTGENLGKNMKTSEIIGTRF